jgi:ribosomal protein L4
VILLERRVNALDLTIAEEKLKAIALLKFSENLTVLKRYLELADYLREYVYFFVEVFKSLKNLKTKLLKNSSRNNAKKRKRYINKTRIILINKKMISFLLLQENLIKVTLLVHFDKEK